MVSNHYSEIEQIVSAFFEKWQRQMKVAMVISTVLSDFNERGIAINEDEIAEHLYRLIDEGDYATYGDIKKWRHSEVVPKIYLKSGGGKLMGTQISGGNDKTEISHSEILEVWKTAIETQKHFAELSIKMRQLGFTLTGGVLAIAIILLRSESSSFVSLNGFKLPTVSFVLLTAAGVMLAASILDVKVYHKMLRGAVKFNQLFEDKHAERLFGIVGMTQTITAFSQNKNSPSLNEKGDEWVNNTKIDAGKKILAFYNIPVFLLIVLSGVFIWEANLTSNESPNSEGKNGVSWNVDFHSQDK